jgi:hypothetical protein
MYYFNYPRLGFSTDLFCAQLDDLENTIVEARDRAELHMQKFMKLVCDGEEAIHAMELAVARISDQVLAPH